MELKADTLQLDRTDPTGSLALYRLDGSASELGLNSSNQLVFGVALVNVHTRGYDPLDDMIQNVGAEAVDSIEIPEDGLDPGKVYQVVVCRVKRDWETGQVDDWDVALVEYTGPVPDQEQEPFHCPTCKSSGFQVSSLGPDRCTFCDGTEGGVGPDTESPPTSGQTPGEQP